MVPVYTTSYLLLLIYNINQFLIINHLCVLVISSHKLSLHRDSSPPVLAGNLPFLGIISILPFSLQNVPFLFSSKRSQICYTYSLKLSKNSTSNASLLKQPKKPERIEELGAKTAKVTIFSDFLKYWEILGFFHSCTVF